MNVVIVNETIAYPPNAGNRIRTLNLMLRMAPRHRITYICRAGEDDDAAATRRAAEFFGDHRIELVVADRAAAAMPASVARYGRLAANLFSPRPFAVASHDSPAVHAAVLTRAARAPVDLWQFEWLPYVDALRGVPDARRLMMAHNVESLIWQRYHQTESHPLKRWYIGLQWRKFERYERRVFAAVDRVVTVSREDAALVRDRFGLDRVSVVDNGVDVAHFADATGRRDPLRILFLGSLDWRPNVDAVRLLLDRIFPAVRAREPRTRLCIVGRNPPAWLIRRAGARAVADAPDAHVELHADVADVRPYLACSGVMVVPLRIGGGSRLKILEAMAGGLPVVSTRVGCEGLALRPGVDLAVVDGVEGVADALLDCFRHPARAADMARRGRQLVQDYYDWDPIADRLDHIWQECAAGTYCPGPCCHCHAGEGCRHRARGPAKPSQA